MKKSPSFRKNTFFQEAVEMTIRIKKDKIRRKADLTSASSIHFKQFVALPFRSVPNFLHLVWKLSSKWQKNVTTRGQHFQQLSLYLWAELQTWNVDSKKMKQVYEANPQLGDPMTIQGQLTENGQKLDKLRAEQKKFQVKICNILNQELWRSKVYGSFRIISMTPKVGFWPQILLETP